MTRARGTLPQLNDDLFLTDGGIETTLMFLEGQDLPSFAAFHLFKTREGVDVLRKYFQTYAQLAVKFEVGLILETATWRSSPDWGRSLGYEDQTLLEVNRQSVRLLEEIRAEYETEHTPIVISGCVGPRGDGYLPDAEMSEKEAEDYHRPQVESFADTASDLVSAITMNYVEEAIGIAQAARKADIPVVIAFTVETDAKLPTGQTLGDAIDRVDYATSGYPAYFMINCAHPTHFDQVINGSEPWAERIRGLRANASRMSHAELNEASELDIGDPIELGRQYSSLRRQQLKHLNVMGGCCGTDARHIEQIATACVSLFR